MVSAGGLDPCDASWVESLEFKPTEIMELWRFAVTSYLWKAHRDRMLLPSATPNEFNDLVLKQTQRRWNIHIPRRIPERSLGLLPDPEEEGSRPLGAGDLASDLGEGSIGFAVVFEAGVGHTDLMHLAMPGTDQAGAWDAGRAHP